MTEIVVDWSEATLESGVGNRFWITAPIRPEHDDFWDLAFRAVLHERVDDIPEDAWSTIGLLNENIVVGGVARGSIEALRAFVDSCVQRANEHIAADRAERLRALQDLERLRAQDDEARRLTEEIRRQAT
jgi:hypothetical protein